MDANAEQKAWEMEVTILMMRDIAKTGVDLGIILVDIRKLILME